MMLHAKQRSIFWPILLFILAAIAMTAPVELQWHDELLFIIAMILAFFGVLLTASAAIDETARHRFYADYEESAHLEMVRMVAAMSTKQLDFIDHHWPAVRIEIRPRDEGAARYCYFSGQPVVYEAVVEIMEAVDDRGYLPAINDNTLKTAKRHDLEQVGSWLVKNSLAEGSRGNLAPRVYSWDKAALALGVIWP